MPRDLPIGNGSLLINFDAAYRLRDLYYPHVGRENHSTGHPFRFGVWCDGTFRWIEDGRWQRDLTYVKGTLVTDVTLRHPDLPIVLTCHDAVDFHEMLYLREIVVSNASAQSHDVRLFFHHDFHISESEVGDTAYYEPLRRAVLHYKGQRWFMINGGHADTSTTTGSDAAIDIATEDVGVDGFACGVKGINGAEGTWRDAEDGVLGGNPIAQGSVDSTIELRAIVAAESADVIYYWMAVGADFEDVTRINRAVRDRGPRTFINRTVHYWRLWGDKDASDGADLSPAVRDLYIRSLLVVRTQIDHEGAIIAANDFDITQFARDTYSYMWPRDGALVAHALIRAGHIQPVEDFFLFCQRVITKEGYFLHKYNPDGSLASSWHPWLAHGQRQLPIQEDETGLVIWALWVYFQHTHNVEFIKPLFRSLIVRAGDFLAAFRDPITGLPHPSYDLWEERRGILLFTVAAVYAGLIAAANFSTAFGETELATVYQQAASKVRAGVAEHMWDSATKRYLRMIVPRADTSATFDRDMVLDASMAGVFLFGLFPADDPRVISTMHAVWDRLWVRTQVGGVARYENDYYHRVSDDITNVPGNPWFICTLWMARWSISQAHTIDDLASAAELLDWTVAHALASGILAEQVNPYTNAPLSVAPLTWSHATFIDTVLDYRARYLALVEEENKKKL